MPPIPIPFSQPEPRPEPLKAREITLLPRHWAWLATQHRSASASLRGLVEDAIRDRDGRHGVRAAQEACYAFMRDTAGDRPHFEEAVRALFAGDEARFDDCVAGWPAAVRDEARARAAPALPATRATTRPALAEGGV